MMTYSALRALYGLDICYIYSSCANPTNTSKKSTTFGVFLYFPEFINVYFYLVTLIYVDDSFRGVTHNQHNNNS